MLGSCESLGLMTLRRDSTTRVDIAALTLLRAHLHAHPRVNAALELGGCAARQDGAANCRTHLGRARFYEDIASTLGLGYKTTEGNGSALWRR